MGQQASAFISDRFTAEGSREHKRERTPVVVMAVFENLPNFRDIGGIEAANGRVVRRGRLFRSGLISRPMKNGADGLSALGIDVVFDLRSIAERVATGSIAPESGAVHEVVAESQAGLKHAKPVDWVRRLMEPEFDGELARRTMLDAYRKMPRALAGVFPALFDHCLSPAAGGMLVHCVAGKDRTGFVCAMLLWALGAPISAIHGDYLRSADGFARPGRVSWQRCCGVPSLAISLVERRKPPPCWALFEPNSWRRRSTRSCAISVR